MKKKTITITENDIKRIVKNSVKRIINEGTTDEQVYNDYYEIVELLGPKNFASEIFNWMGHEQLVDFVEHIKRHYDM